MASEREAKAKFSLDTSEFTKSVQQANSALTTLRSELRLNSEQLKDNGDSVDLLQQRQELLGNQAQQTQNKIDALTSKLQAAKDAFGDGSVEVQKLETQLNNAQTSLVKVNREIDANAQALSDLNNSAGSAQGAFQKLESTISSQTNDLNKLKNRYADLVVSQQEGSKEAQDLARQIQDLSTELSQNERKLQEAAKAADELGRSYDDAGDSASKASGKLGSVAKGVGGAATGVIAGVAALGGAIISFVDSTQQEVENLGRLESAYESVGLSTETASEVYGNFMGLLGDSDTATEAAQDMANLAQAGGDIDTWYTIAAGAAATFGDALPTENLIESANETARTGTITGGLADAYNWTGTSASALAASLGDGSAAQAAFNDAINQGLPIEDAMNAALSTTSDTSQRQAMIQSTLNTLLGESGQKYLEANSSLISYREAQGQLNQTLATLSEALMPLVTAFMNFGNTLLTNVLPSVQQVSTALSGMFAGDPNAQAQFVEGITGIFNTIITTVSNMLPQLLLVGTQILQGLLTGILTALPTFLESLMTILPQILTTIMQMATQLVTFLAEYIPTLLPMIVQLIVQLAQAFIQALPTFIQALTDLILQLVNMLPTFIPQLLQAAVTLFMAMVDALPQILTQLLTVLPQIITSVCELIPTFLPMLMQAALQMFMGLVECLPEILSALLDALPEVLNTVIDLIPTFLPMLLDAGVQMFTGLIEALPQILPDLLAAVGDLITQLPGKIIEFIPQLVQAGIDLIGGLIEGIIQAAANVLSAIGDLCSNIWNSITGFFGISSPSKLMEATFKWVPIGAAEGIDDEQTVAVKSMLDMGGAMADAASSVTGQIDITPSYKVNDASIKNSQDVMGDWLNTNLESNIDATDALASRIDDLSSAILAMNERIISIEIDGKQIAKAIAGSTDRVNGTRQAYVRRGLSV